MNMTLIGIAATVVWILYYAGSCWLYPLAYCLCCKGAGRHHRKDGKVFRECRWPGCEGGRRWRVGRRIWNYFHNKRSRA